MDGRLSRIVVRMGCTALASWGLSLVACAPPRLDIGGVQVRTGSLEYVLEGDSGPRGVTIDVTIYNAGARIVFVHRLCGFMDQPESRLVDPVAYEPSGPFVEFACPDRLGPRPPPIALDPGAVYVDRRDFAENRRGEPDWGGRFRLSYDITSSADPKSRSIAQLPPEQRVSNAFDVRSQSLGTSHARRE